jgi:hypothetical protein
MHLWVDTDHVPSHRSKVSTPLLAFNSMKKAHQRPSSLDLAPGLLLVGNARNNLMGYHAQSPFGLLARTQIILRDFLGKRMFEAFLESIDPLRKWIDVNGEYIGEAKSNQSITINLRHAFAGTTVDVNTLYFNQG